MLFLVKIIVLPLLDTLVTSIRKTVPFLPAQTQLIFRFRKKSLMFDKKTV